MRGILLRVGGTAVGLLLGFVTGVWEVFLSPLYIGRVPLPVAPVLAVAGNLGVVWFTYAVTRHKGLALLPGVAWFAALVMCVTKTTEGDLPIPSSDWMGLLVLMLGALAWGAAGYRMILPSMLPPPVTPQASAETVVPAGRTAPEQPGAGRTPKPGARPARAGRRPGGGRGRDSRT